MYNADRLGIFTPKQVDRTELKCGEVGWLVCAIKDILGAPVGDTLTLARNPADKALPGFKKVKPQVYAGLFPVSSDDYENFRDALGKLSLNDASLFYEPESSTALGFGFRCGFLGLLHMEIIQERLEREYDLDLITTAPTVVYEVETTSKEVIYVDSPSKLPPLNNIQGAARADRGVSHAAAAGVFGQRHHPVYRKARRTDQHGLPRQSGCADL